MVDNNKRNKDSLLVLLLAKRKPANYKASHVPWSREIIPTSQISLASTLYTQDLFTPVAVMHEKYFCVEDSSSGLRQILVLIAKCSF